MNSGTTLAFENFFQYTPAQFEIVQNVLTLGYAAMAAGLVYFLLTLKQSAPKLQLPGIISCVVMASAFLALFALEQNWRATFVFNSQTALWTPTGSGSSFNNGYRYINWTIDVPMLLTQFLIAIGLTGRRFQQIRWRVAIGGLLMIYTGYIGQFYETSDLFQFYLWGTVSTVFYVYVLWVLLNAVSKNAMELEGEPRDKALYLRWWVLVTWTLYPIAYLMPVLWFDAWGVVTRQILYTVADISTKVLFGVLLADLVTLRSAQRGHPEAVQSLRP